MKFNQGIKKPQLNESVTRNDFSSTLARIGCHLCIILLLTTVFVMDQTSEMDESYETDITIMGESNDHQILVPQSGNTTLAATSSSTTTTFTATPSLPTTSPLSASPTITSSVRGETNDAGVVITSFDIHGTVEGGYAGIADTRELYNPGNTAAVWFIFPVTDNAVVSSIDAIQGNTIFTLHESQGEKSRGDILNSKNRIFFNYLEKDESTSCLNDLITRYSDSTLLAFHNSKLLICQFPMEQRTFLNITVRYSISLDKVQSLTTLELPIVPSFSFTAEGFTKPDSASGTLSLEVNSVSTLERIFSPTHQVNIQMNNLHSGEVQWNGRGQTGEIIELHITEIDFPFGGGFLNYRIPSKTMFQVDEDGYFMFLFSPNTAEFSENRLSKDIVFIIDTSGSMSGEKIQEAKDALKNILGSLGNDDRFTIVSFSNNVIKYRDIMIYANPQAISSAQSYVDTLSSGGSTDINNALLTGLNCFSGASSGTSSRPRQVIFLTDGEATCGVTNNENILENVRNANGVNEIDSDLFVFGVGYDINTYLLDRLSSDSGGNTLYIKPDQDLQVVLTAFYETISSPVLTDISFEIEGIRTMATYPADIPVLCKGGELSIVGVYQYEDGSSGGNGDMKTDLTNRTITVFVNGTTTTGPVHYIFTFPMEEPGRHSYLPSIYGTRLVGELLQDIRQNGETTEKVDQVKHFSLRYGIETPYTTMALQSNIQFDSEGFRTLTGEASVHTSEVIQSYTTSKFAGVGLSDNGQRAGGRTFINMDGLYVDTSLLPGDDTITLENSSIEEWICTEIGIDRFVKFASAEYFSMAQDKKTRDFLSLGPEVVYLSGNEIVGVTRGGLLLYINDLRARTSGQDLSITWVTSEPATSVLHYRPVGENSTGEWIILRDDSFSESHNLTVTLPYEEYEFFVESTDTGGNTAVKDNSRDFYQVYHFPLSIVSVRINVGYAVLAGQTVTVRWYTNIPATGTLYYREEMGDWIVLGTTMDTTFHEISFEVPVISTSWGITHCEFFITVNVGDLLIVEDNNGEYFSFEVTATTSSSPSFHLTPALIVSGGVFIVVLSYLGKRSFPSNVQERSVNRIETGDAQPNDRNVAKEISPGGMEVDML